VPERLNVPKIKRFREWLLREMEITAGRPQPGTD
jgi:hypothetical protein